MRATACETLDSGKGFCGEVTRAFIGLARHVGVDAHRLNLYGGSPHVVAVADLGDGEATLIDCQSPPRLPDLQRLDEALLRPEFRDYSTLNLRRTGFGTVVPRLKLDLGWVSYLTENPHALKAALAGLLAAALWAAYGLRTLLRAVLRRRGWLHVTDAAAVQRAVGRQSQPIPPQANPPQPRHDHPGTGDTSEHVSLTGRHSPITGHGPKPAD